MQGTKLRFGSFSDRWTSTTIGQILTIKHGKDYKHLPEGDIPVLGTGGKISGVTEALCNWPCVLIGRKGTINKPQYMDVPFWSVDTLFYSKAKDGQSPKFQYYLFQTIDWLKYNEASGVPSLSAATIENITVNVPSLDEQQKIASFFSTLDEKISITREKITCLQKINGRLVRDVMDGKIRFSMRDGKRFPDWKRERLGESFSVKMCKRIFKEETLDIGDVPFYKIGTLGSEPDSYITQEQFELYKTKYSYPSAGDTLISCSGTVGRCVVFDGSPSYFQDSNIVWLESKESNFVYDKGYLTAVLQNFTWNELSSSTIKRIYSKDLLGKEWYVPCVEEQRLISKFIFELNEKVALEDKKLLLLIKLKKSFMQQMFS